VSKSKRKFSAALKMNAEHKAKFVFEDKPALAAAREAFVEVAG